MTYADDVRKHYLHDPLCSDGHYAHLMEQAHEADYMAELLGEVSDEDAERQHSLDTEAEGVYPGRMTDPLDGLTVTMPLTEYMAINDTRMELERAVEAWEAACYETQRSCEEQVADLNALIIQLHKDLAFADQSAATNHQGAVRIVDELCAERDALVANSERLREELAQEKRFKAGWIDKALVLRACVHDLETEVVHLSETRQREFAELQRQITVLRQERDEARRKEGYS